MRAQFAFAFSLLLIVAQVSTAQPPAPMQPMPTLPRVEVTPEEEYYGDTGYGSTDWMGYPSIPWSSSDIYSDTQRVGPYNQPQWTTQRPFASTRSYVLPPGTVQVEQWARPTYPKDGKPEWRMLEEVAIGLPGRFQLDLYERWNIEPNSSNNEEANHEGVQIELRWALADWDEIWLNPTIYLEWIERGGPQEKPNKYEIKLLLSEEIGCNWYWATNFNIEQETSGERETELSWTMALGTTIIERKLSAGIEMVIESATVQGSRNDASFVYKLGPGLQYRPTNRTFLDVVALFGVTEDAPDAQLYFIFGYQFGSRAAPTSEIGRPASARGN